MPWRVELFICAFKACVPNIEKGNFDEKIILIAEVFCLKRKTICFTLS